MKIEQLNGKWTGFFVYGDKYPISQRHKKSVFTVDIRVNDGMVQGECMDDLVRQFFTNPATIDGAFENGVITFIKRYPSLVAIDENGVQTVFADKPSHEILYTGQIRKRLFSNKIYFKGKWDISGSFLDENKTARYYTLGGTWEMEK